MRKWLYDSVRDVDQAPIDRLRQFPREPDMLVYGLRSLGALIIRRLLQIYNHFEIIGHQNLRTNRSLVIVANHCSHIDTLCLLAALPLRKLHRAFPAAASDYFSGRHKIDNRRSWRIQIRNRRSCCGTRRRGCAVFHRWIISGMA